VVEGKVGYLKNPLIHMADPSCSRYLMRWNRYTDLMAYELRQEFRQKSAVIRFWAGLEFIFIKPVWWFLLTYVRHKGFLDSWQGFVFSFFSSLRFPMAYLKYLRRK